jgi:hypothetical protein
MVKNNHYELNKCTLINSVDKSLNQSLSKKNIKNKFRVIGIWPFNPNAMDDKAKFHIRYT